MNDYGWDKRLNIKTMGRSDINEDYNHFAYEPTAYAVLLRLAERGYITKDNTLIDYGCGKGRVSFFLSHRTGCRAVGVEYDGDLIEIAVRNLREFRGNRGRISFAHSDAEHFTLPLTVDRFYFFNPFSIKILYPVLERIYASYCEEPRQMYLFFYYPSEEYISHIMREDRLMFVDEIETADLFPGEDVRERIMVFTLSA